MLKVRTCGGSWRLCSKIGCGSFGVVYSGVHINSGKQVAIKLECANSRESPLACEYRAYRHLKGGIGIPRVYWFGKVGNYNALVIDLLGPNLQDLFKLCSKKFRLKTILMLADQLLVRIKYLHDKSYIHRDIKPENFVVGLNKRNINLVYIIDFGLAKMYRNPVTHKHIPPKDRNVSPGTARYSSINLHLGSEQSRRDDLESIGFVLMYFNLGKLPWQALKGDTWTEKYSKIVKKKLKTSVWDLCKGFPPEFATYLNYCRGLRFDEKPDYSYLRSLFRDLFSRRRYAMDYRYDWIVKLKSSTGDKRLSSKHHHVGKKIKIGHQVKRMRRTKYHRLAKLALDFNVCRLSININI